MDYKLILKSFLIVFTVGFISFAASAQTAKYPDAASYLEASEKQHKLAKKLLIYGGSGIVVGGGFLLYSNYINNKESDNMFSGDFGVSQTIGAIIGISGLVVTTISLTKFSKAKKYKQKAYELEPTLETTNYQYLNQSKSMPTVGLRLKF
ncbi:hypothetical protein [Sphingobacterium hungaricum]